MQLPDIRNVEELIALAVALERRAAARFRGLAERMRMDGRVDLSALFERLAGEEDAHEAKLQTIAEQKAIDLWPAEKTQLESLGEGGPLPNTEDLARASVYDCLAEAVRNEEKAFAFFSYLAAHAEDPALEAEAEALAKEELAHAHLLRRARREAFHQRPPAISWWPDPASIRNLRDFLRVAANGEAEIARRLFVAAHRLPQCDALSDAAARMSASLGSPPGAPRDTPLGPQDGEPVSDDALQEAALDDAEEAFVFYDAVATSAAQEDTMLKAQELSAYAVERLRVLREAVD